MVAFLELNLQTSPAKVIDNIDSDAALAESLHAKSALGKITLYKITLYKVSLYKVVSGKITPCKVTPCKVTPSKVTPSKVTPAEANAIAATSAGDSFPNHSWQAPTLLDYNNLDTYANGFWLPNEAFEGMAFNSKTVKQKNLPMADKVIRFLFITSLLTTHLATSYSLINYLGNT